MERIKIVILAFLLGLGTVSEAQIIIEAGGFAGGTLVDYEQWLGSSVNDWSNFTSGGYLQVHPIQFGPFTIGAELGFNSLFWYQTSTDFTTVDRYVSPMNVSGVARVYIKKLFLEGAAGAYLFDGFTDIGIRGGVGYEIKVTDSIHIPIKLSGALIFDSDQNLAVGTLSGGLSYTFSTK